VYLPGNGLKDPATAIEYCQDSFKQGIEPELAAVAKVMGFE
jgi:threonine synthase